MFVIKQSNSYTWPVSVEFPVDNGKFEKQTFDAEFKRVTAERKNQIIDEIKSGETTDEKICNEVLIGWKGVVDDKGDEMPFSEAAKKQLMSIALVSGAVAVAFLASLSGNAAKRKN